MIASVSKYRGLTTPLNPAYILDKIPDIAKGMAQGIRKVKDATQEIKSEIKKSAEKKGIDTDSISKEIDKVKDDIDDLTGSMKRKL